MAKILISYHNNHGFPGLDVRISAEAEVDPENPAFATVTSIEDVECIDDTRRREILSLLDRSRYDPLIPDRELERAVQVDVGKRFRISRLMVLEVYD